MQHRSAWLLLLGLPTLGACTSFSDADLSAGSAGEAGQSAAGASGQAGSGGSVAGSSGQSGAGQGGTGGSGQGGGGVAGATGGQAGMAGNGQAGGGQAGGGQAVGGQAGNEQAGGGQAGGGQAGAPGGGGASGGGGAGGDKMTTGGQGGGGSGGSGAGGSESVGGAGGTGGGGIGGGGPVGGQGGTGQDPPCGDNACEPGETCQACPEDCGSCSPVCGDGVCNGGEACSTCPQDCPSGCGPVCDDGVCDPQSESCALCPADCTCSVCGNGKIEVGEECDGAIQSNCQGYLKGGGFGGSPVCQSNCQVDLSACEYCGNGKLDPSETCDGDTIDISCESVGAGEGAASCKGCQVDTSACSQPICGSKLGLSLTSPWPAQGGCMRRPNQSGALSPKNPKIQVAIPISLGAQLSPQFAVGPNGAYLHTPQGVYEFSNQAVKKLSGTSMEGSTQALITLDDSSFVRVTENGVDHFEVNGGTHSLIKDWNLSGLPTATAVVLDNTLFVPRADGKIWGIDLSVSLALPIFTSQTELGGTMAHDDLRNRLYVATTCMDKSCKLLSLTPGLMASKKWDLDIGGPSGPEGCHAAVAANGTIYTTCGSTVKAIHPEQPAKYTVGISLSNGSQTSAPAISAEGTVYLVYTPLSTVENGTLMALSPQLSVQWSVSLDSQPLSAPLLDKQGNIQLCMSGEIQSFTPGGSPRWSVPLPGMSSACAMTLLDGALLVATSNSAYLLGD